VNGQVYATSTLFTNTDFFSQSKMIISQAVNDVVIAIVYQFNVKLIQEELQESTSIYNVGKLSAFHSYIKLVKYVQVNESKDIESLSTRCECGLTQENVKTTFPHRSTLKLCLLNFNDVQVAVRSRTTSLMMIFKIHSVFDVSYLISSINAFNQKAFQAETERTIVIVLLL
jgi:hypothetical protein